MVDSSSTKASSPGFMLVTQSNFTDNIAMLAGGALFTNVPEDLHALCHFHVEVLEASSYGARLRPGVTAVRRPPRNIKSDLAQNCSDGNLARTDGGGDLMATTAVTMKICANSSRTCTNGDHALHIDNHTSGEELETISWI